MAPRLLLVGGGFIGSAVASLAAQRRLKFTVLSRSKTCPPSLVSLLRSAGEYVYGDCRDATLIERLVPQHDGVIYLAHANMRGVAAAESSLELVDNLMAATSVFSVASRHGKKTVVLSSGGTVYGEPRYLPINEEHPLAPVAVYGLTKLSIESCASYYGRVHGLEAVILRPANAYGPGQIPFRGQGFVATAIAMALSSRPVRIFGCPGTIRDYIFVDDVANAVLMAFAKGQAGEAYNVGSGKGLTNEDVLDVLEPLAERDGFAVQREYADARRQDVSSNILDSSKFCRATGWTSSVSFEDGLETTYSHLKGICGPEVFS